MKKNIPLFIAVSFLFLSSSCAVNSNRGTIRENHEVTNIFRSYEVVEDYNYFYYGVYLEPDTIMGIDKKYTVQSKFWKPIELTPEQLETWVIRLDRIRGDTDFARRYMGRYQGAYILDPEKSVIGIWYSKLDWGVFDFPGENIIIPYPPSLKPGSEGIRFRRGDD
ncbi:MAG: hypothetical protein V2I35_03800 [Desulfocapsaceae bacterium]|nr:hypothetical protein [Desulfocapsaceae bacterium]